MNRRLAIITEIIAPYRIPVFNVLAETPGIDLHVIFLAETDHTMRDWLVYKNEIRFRYSVLPSYRKRIGNHNLLFNRGLGKTLRDFAPHIILCGGYSYLASWQALFWAKKRKIPFLLWIESHARDARRNNPAVEVLKRFFIRQCDAFVVPGKASAEYLNKFKVRAKNIYTAPNAVDNELFRRLSAEVKSDAAKWRSQLKLPQRYFVFVGRLVPEKGVFDLLDAYGEMNSGPKERIGLVFAGDGPARAELERRASRISPGVIELVGFVQREMLPAYYALAAAMVLPTHTDAWGLAVNEAMACGLPVICTDVAGCVPDLVDQGWNGYVVPVHDMKALTRALEKIAAHSEALQGMGENSAKRIEHYSPQACAAGIAEAACSAGGQHE